MGTLLLPFLGVLAYLITQGRSMTERAEREAARQRAETDAYIRSVVAGADAAQPAQPAQAAQAHEPHEPLDSGAITSDEFEGTVPKGRP